MGIMSATLFLSAGVTYTHRRILRHARHPEFACGVSGDKRMCSEEEDIFKLLCHFVFRSSRNNKAKRSRSPCMYYCDSQPWVLIPQGVLLMDKPLKELAKSEG